MCKKLQRIKALPALLILALMFALCITAYGTDADEPAAAAEAAVQITKQPQSVTVEEGEMARVQFTAEGEGLTYTWYFKDAGDTAFRKTATFTGAYYSAKMTSDRDGRQLYCVVTDENGNKATTDTVTINMGTVAKIVTQPQSVTVANGSVAKVSLAAEGDGITYTWYYKNGAGASFAVTNSFKGDTYKTTMNPERAGRQVYCVITDKYGNSVTSDVVTLNMTGAVQITKQPGTVIVPDGQSFSIKVSAKGEGLTYAWYYKDKGSDTFKLTTTFKGSSYSSTMTAARDGRQVYCVITDEYGCSVRTNTVSMIMGVPVSVVRQPSSVVVPSGEKFTVSVKAIGDELTYTWYFRNKGASSFSKTDSFKGAEYYATMTDARDGRQVYCVIADKYGNSVTTDTVTLTMGNPATIVKQPSSVVVLEGETANVTLEATGDGLTYAWYYKDKNGTSFLLTTSFTGSSYRVTMTPERDGRQVYCVITDKYGSSVTTDTVTLIMGQPVSIVKQPASAVVMLGHKASVSVDAVGVELTYQWYFKNPGGTKFHKSSVTTDTYTVKMADSVNGRQVYCVITDKYGNSVKTETVTIKLGATIITQPQSVTVADGSTAKVSVEAEGDGIKYQWYFKNPGGTKFHKSSVTTDTYTVKMSASADERQVYCVITDSAGNTVTTDIVTIYMAHSYGEGVVENEVSCTKDGITVYTCSDCGKVKTVVTPATGHAMGDWQVHREPTPENEGVERSSCANCSYYNDRSIEKIKAVYHIIVDLGNGETYSVGVGANGVYTLATPVKIGYNFLGWKDSAGNAFEGSGTVSENCIVSAVWELDGTDTLEKLIKRAEAGVDKIVITADIIVNKPIFISYNTTIYSDEDHTLLRAPNYAGDIFVVGQDKYGTDSILYHRVGVLTLGGGKGVLTIDGNRDNLTVTVVGSAVYVADSGILNLHNGTRIVNNLKLGNDRVLRNTDYVSVYTVERAGGAAILSLNATVNMYGGVIDNNEVYTEYTIVTNEDGTESWLTNYACGGAVYSRGGFNMYGGVISNSRALRGGGIYSDSVLNLYAGKIVGNSATKYGGGVSTSSSMNADTFIGTEDGFDTMILEGNVCDGAGGALYSNTSSPIIIYGNAVFVGNHSETSGGAIHTAGDLTVRGAEFIGNTSIGSGGAIYNYYTKADFERRHMNLENCVFKNNSSNLGGAIILSSSGAIADEGTYAVIKNCVFTENEASLKDTSKGSGGAIYITRNSDAVITGCEFSENISTGSGGAVSAQSGTTVILTNSTFNGNSAVTGGAICTSHSTFTAEDLTFSGNSASDNGGAMYLNQGVVGVKNLDFYNNSAVNNGGAVYMKALDLNFTSESEFEGNTAGGHGGSFYLTYITDSEGVRTGSVLTANGVTFRGGSAMGGGAISIRSSCEAILTDCTLEGNIVSGYSDKNEGNGEGGGAIYVGYGKLTLNNVSASGNEAYDFGGVVTAVGSTLDINGGTFNANKAYSGGAVYARESTVNVIGVNFTENESVYENVDYNSDKGGGAINVYNTVLNVVDSDFTNNKTDYYGGAVITSKSTVTISDSTFTGNTGGTGAAVYFKNNSYVTVTDTTVTDNVAGSNGVVYQNGGTLDLVNVTATGNKGGNGGVLYASGSNVTNVKNSNWSGNTAGTGGVIYVGGATVNLDGCTVNGNTANNAGAIYNKAGTVKVTNTEFSNNSSVKTASGGAGSGGAIGIAGGLVELSDGTFFTGNSAEGHGGAIHVSYTTNTDNTVTVGNLIANGIVFESNKAMGGGAVSVRTDCTADIVSCTFKGNSTEGNDGKSDGYGEGGGAVYVGFGTATVTDSEFTENTSTERGGAIHSLDAAVTVTDSVFTGNEANSGGAVYAMSGSSLTAHDCSFTKNKANANAGALYIGDPTTADLKNVTFTENEAVTHAGAVYINKGIATFDNVDMLYNKAGVNGGAIYIAASELNTDDTCDITGNTAGGHGGAVYLTYVKTDSGNVGAVLNANGTAFTENTALAGGAISIRTSCAANLTDVSLIRNSVTGYEDENDGDGDGGGAVYVGFGTLSMTNVTATGNSAEHFGGVVDAYCSTVNVIGGNFTENTAGTGGVIYSLGSSTVTVENATMKDNGSVYDHTVFDSNKGGGAIAINKGTLNVIGTTFEGNTTGYYGGAIHANGTTVNISKDTVITGHEGVTGAALYFRGGSVVTITDTTVKDNTASGNGVIYQNGGTLLIDNVTANGNTAGSGGVLFVSGGSTNATIKNSSWTDNNAKQGGAICINDSTVTVESCIFKNNVSRLGGVVYNKLGTFNTVDTVYEENRAENDGSGNGGAISISGGTVNGTGSNTFINNSADGHGGAIYVSYFTAEDEALTKTYGVLNMTNGIFDGNSAFAGGAISSRTGSEVTLTGTELKNNTASSIDADKVGGGAIYTNNNTLTLSGVIMEGNTSAYYGGGVFAESATVDVIDGSVLNNNVGVTGAAIYVKGASNVTVNGAAVTADGSGTISGNGTIYATGSGTMDITGLTASGNNKYNGGVIYVSGSVNVNVNSSSFSGNAAAYLGGVIDFRSSGTLTVTDTEFIGNTAKNGGAINVTGTGTVNVTGSTFKNNSATNIGGAITASEGAKVTVTDTEFIENTAAVHGGAVHVHTSELSLTGVTASKNTAGTNGGAVYSIASLITVGENTQFVENAATGHGGAIYLNYNKLETGNVPSTLVATGATFDGNTAMGGGAVSICTGCSAELIESTLINNSVTGFADDNDGNGEGGGAIYVGFGSLTLTDVTATGNKSEFFGGVVDSVKSTVTVNGGVYTGNEATNGGVIYGMTSSKITVNGAEFTGNNADLGGAIMADSGSIVTVTDASFKENASVHENADVDNTIGGGAIYVDDAELTVSGTSFSGNTTGYYGGAIFANSSTVTINGGSVVENNSGVTGAAIYLRGGCITTIENSAVTDNVSTGSGVIYQNGGKITFANVTAAGNEANRGGVLYVSGGSTSVFVNECSWNNNFAKNGGAIYMDNATIEITSSEFAENSSHLGGAIYNRCGELTIEGTEFTNNSATHDANGGNGNGGAILVTGGTLTSRGSNTFEGNTAANHGGAIYGSYVTNTDGSYTGASVNVYNDTFANNSAIGGGAISVRTNCSASLDRCTFTENSSNGNDGKADGYGEGGGAVYVGYGTLSVVESTFERNTATEFGGAIHILESKADIKASFESNAAKNGGAVYAMGKSTLNVSDSAFVNNGATSSAGAIFINDDVVTDLTNVTFENNNAKIHAGALYINQSTITVANVDMTGNHAGSNGGAIYLCGTELSLDSESTFTNNTAVGHGGAIYVVYKTIDEVNVGAVLNANGTAFTGNTAMAGGAISLRSACTVNLTDCTLTGNSVTGYANENDGNGEGGGAIYTGFGTLNMTNVTATGNSAEQFGGVVDSLGSTVTITGGKYSENTANAGGVVYALSASTVNVIGAEMSGNKSVYENTDYNSSLGGGAITIMSGTLNIKGATISANATDYYGGAILTSGTTVNISDSTVISGNEGGTGAALHFKNGSKVTISDSTVNDNVATSNGVIYQNGGTITLERVTASGNSANAGGVLYLSGASTVANVNESVLTKNSAKNGGAIFMDKLTVNIVGSDLTENSATNGGAVYNRTGNLVIDGAEFVGNTATNGGAVYLSGGVMTTNNENTFSGNIAETNGGAVYVTSYTPSGDNPTTTYGALTMTNGLFEGNTAYVGGAVYSDTGCTVSFVETEFKSNVANCKQSDGLGGGAIYAKGSTVEAALSTFDGNSSAYYGGAIFATNSTVNLTRGTDIKNNVAITGVAIYVNGSDSNVTIDDVILRDNVYRSGTGNGVIYGTNAATFNIIDTVATGNKATNGGFMYVSGAVNVTVTNSSVSDSTATASGGVFDFRSSGTLTLIGSTFSNNTAKNGGVIHADSGTVKVEGCKLGANSATVSGGAIFATGKAKVTVSDDTIIELNTAPTGGAVFIDAGATVEIIGCTLDSNTATGDGGAITVADTTEEGTSATALYLNGVTLSNNVAGSKGGAIATDTVSPNLEIIAAGCNFIGNSATGAGGGAVEIQNQNCNSAEDPTKVTIRFINCTFEGNSAKSTGGAVEIRTQSCALFDGITAANNKANQNGGVIYVTSNYSRCYLTGDVVISGNTSAGGTFVHLYTTSSYTNPPKLYTTHSSSAEWCGEIGGTNVVYDLTEMPQR